MEPKRGRWLKGLENSCDNRNRLHKTRFQVVESVVTQGIELGVKTVKEYGDSRPVETS